MNGPPPSDSRDAVPSRTNLQAIHMTFTLVLKKSCSLAVNVTQAARILAVTQKTRQCFGVVNHEALDS